MKKIGIVLGIMTILIALTGCVSNKIKNSVTQTATVKGNCGMCKNNIERAGTEAKISLVKWSAEEQLATITYNPQKTTKSKILRKIADAGYSNELFEADLETYSKLPNCCQYSRKQSEKSPDEEAGGKPHNHGSHNHDEIYMSRATEIDRMEKTGLEWLYVGCYKLTNSLIINDKTKAADYAGSIYRGIETVQDSTIDKKAILTWNLFKLVIQADASGIANSKDLADQRKQLSRLSQNVFALMKVHKPTSSYYLKTCVYNGGMLNNSYDWISKDEENKTNPYGFTDLCGVVRDRIIIK